MPFSKVFHKNRISEFGNKFGCAPHNKISGKLLTIDMFICPSRRSRAVLHTRARHVYRVRVYRTQN